MIARHLMRRRPRILTALGLLALPALAAGQAPATPEHAWEIPENAIERATALADHEKTAPTERPYDLVQLIDLAERSSPDTRAAWEEARAAAAGIGLAEAAYLPQLSFQALGGFEHTPLPVPKDLVGSTPASATAATSMAASKPSRMTWCTFSSAAATPTRACPA